MQKLHIRIAEIAFVESNTLTYMEFKTHTWSKSNEHDRFLQKMAQLSSHCHRA